VIVRYFPGRVVTVGIRAIVCTRVELTNFNHWFLNKILPRLLGFAKYVGIKDKLDRKALEGNFGFFQVAY
jgi:hypothetical protein